MPLSIRPMGSRMNPHITLERLYLFMGRWENNRFAEDEGFSSKRNYIKLIKYILIAGFVIVGSQWYFRSISKGQD